MTKYINYIRKRFNDTRVPVFNINELKLIKGLSRSYLKLLVHNLLSKGEIRRITRGMYTFHRDADVLCFAFQPAYYGLEDALSILGISDQGTNPSIITIRNARRGVRSFEGRNYVINHIDKKFFFGYELMKHGSFWIPVSDLEKTVIDMVYFKYHIREELWEGILERIDKKKLNSYLEAYEPAFRIMVLREIGKSKGELNSSKLR